MYSVSKRPRGEKRFFHNRALTGAMSRSAYQITNSLLFRGGQKLYKSFTSSSTWGLSVLVRRNALGAVNPILGSAVKFNASDTLTAGSLTTTAVYRDPTAWMHIAIAGGHLWVNGVDMGATTTSAFTCSATNCLGYDGTNYLGAEIAEFAFADGSQPAYAPGRTDGTTDSWAPNPVSATWGTNGCYLGKPWNAADLGNDYSGQNNDWTPTGFVSTDVLSDSPTNVYATLNPLSGSVGSGAYMSGGNLTIGGTSVTGHGSLPELSQGKWYWEVKVDSQYYQYPDIGVWSSAAGSRRFGAYSTGNANGAGFIAIEGGNTSSAGLQYGETSYQTTTAAPWNTVYTVGDVIGIALDLTNGKIWFRKNGTWLQGDPVAGTSPAATFNPALYTYTPAVFNYSSSVTFNFGQRAFAASAPTGFKALCTANLPATTGATSGSFTGNASADGPCIYTGAVPATLTINGNTVTWGTHADKLATGFKLRTSSTSYNASSTNNWVATYSTPAKPTVGSNKVPANAQGNP